MNLWQLAAHALRLVGYLGLIFLVMIAVTAGFLAWPDLNAHGFLMLALFFAIVAFLAYSLWSQGRGKKHTEPELDDAPELDMELTMFLRGPLLHTAEGVLVLSSGAVSLLLALFYWLKPRFASTPLDTSGTVLIFALWPLVLLIFYVRFCAPHFRSSIYTTLSMLCMAGIPYYIVYG